MDEEHVQHLFDSYCRKVLRNAINDYYDSLLRRRRWESLLTDYPQEPSAADTYDLGDATYIVFGEPVRFSDPIIVDALNSLTELDRTIALAASVLGFSDRTIADRLQMVRRTLTYRRSKIYEALRCYLRTLS